MVDGRKDGRRIMGILLSSPSEPNGLPSEHNCLSVLNVNSDLPVIVKALLRE